MKIKVKKFTENAVIPFKKYDSDFCYDCVATSVQEIAPNVFKYGLGIALQVERTLEDKIHYQNVCITLRPRSSVWKTGMVLSNCVGTVDEEYTGEISAVFYKVIPNGEPYKVGERICQMHLSKAEQISFDEVVELENTSRGENGYGSTGR